MGFCYPLEQHRTAAAADQAAHPVAQDAVLLEGDDPLAVLPAHSQIIITAVAALADGQLVYVHVYPSFTSSDSAQIGSKTPDTRAGIGHLADPGFFDNSMAEDSFFPYECTNGYQGKN